MSPPYRGHRYARCRAYVIPSPPLSISSDTSFNKIHKRRMVQRASNFDILSRPTVHPLSLTCRIGLSRKHPRVDSRASGLKPPSSVFFLCCRCQECPVVKPTFLCGNDNRTYSSPCRLEYHNCIHHTSVHIACKGFCPCKGKRYICPRA